MNIVSVIELLQTKINNSTDSSEIIYLSKAIEILNLGTIKTVSTYSNLLSVTPDIKSAYFVEDEKKLYYFYFSWILLFDFASLETRAWGNNGSGRLGDGTITSRSSPVSVVGGFTDWISASAGYTHSLAIRNNGTAWAWGFNGNGQLGDGTTTSRISPVSVVGGFTDWIDVSAGEQFSLGLRANGTAWAWGLNTYGRLGDNTTTTRSSPVSVVGGFSDWIQISASVSSSITQAHSLGLRSNGTIWAWGRNLNGRLGDNTLTDRSSPVSVIGGFTDWKHISAGGRHSLGLRDNGTAWAWGYNGQGQLGDDTTTSQLSPVSVVGGFTDWVSASAGGRHSLGLRANGTLWAWGYNGSGRLGDGTTTSRLSPVSVVGGFTDWIDVSAGSAHSLGLRANGTLWAWGLNNLGQLGDNTTVSKISPVSVVGGFTDWVSASAGDLHSLGLRVKSIK